MLSSSGTKTYTPRCSGTTTSTPRGSFASPGTTTYTPTKCGTTTCIGILAQQHTLPEVLVQQHELPEVLVQQHALESCYDNMQSQKFLYNNMHFSPVTTTCTPSGLRVSWYEKNGTPPKQELASYNNLYTLPAKTAVHQQSWLAVASSSDSLPALPLPL